MIIFDKRKKLFHLQGKNFSYIMYVNEMGYLQSVYFGIKIDADDYLLQDFSTSVAPNPRDGKNMLNDMPCEYGTFGRGDYRSPSVLIERSDGFFASELKYVSHKNYDGVPRISGMPHTRSGGQTLEIKLKDDLSDTEIILNYTVYEEYDVLVRNAEIKNAGNSAEFIRKAFSFSLQLQNDYKKMLYLTGHWARERSPEICEITHGTKRIDTARGASSHQMSPFAAFLKDGCGEEYGECIGVSLIYSGSFAITAQQTHTGAIRVQGGINDFAFGWKLDGGDSFVTPQAAICFSGNGLGHMSREFAQFYRERILPPRFDFKKRPIVVNNWEGTYFDFDEKKLCNIIDSARGTGIDTFVLDDGWFGKRNDDKSSLGDWFVNEEKLKGGLKAVIDRCKKNGLRFGLWLEPEMISENSELYRKHPDWAIGKAGVEPVRGRNQLVLDFSRKEIVDCIFRVISKLLTDNEISYVKWDMNRNITEFYSETLPYDRQGELSHRYILGVYDLADRLTQAFPDILFEGCAGGGGRFDGGMLYYFPQIWTSDNTDGYDRSKIQYGTSLCFPVSAMSCHVSVCPNHQTGRTVPFKTRGDIASLGATGYELDLTKLSEEERQLIKKQIENYNGIADLIIRGDLYRLSNPFEDDYFCEMIVSKDKAKAYVVGERKTGIPSPCDYNRILRLFGLAEDKKYRIEELEITASGKTLINAGVLFPRLNDFESWTWHICEVPKG